MRNQDNGNSAGITAWEPGSIDNIDISARTPMHHHIWVQASADTLYPDQQILVMRTGENTEAGIGVFAQQKGFPGRLFLVGAEELGEQADLIFGSEASALALATQFKQTGRAGRFGHFSENSIFLVALKTAFKKGGYVATAPVQGSPYIDLDESWSDPLSHFTSRYRSDFKRMRRKADALGTVDTEILSPTPDTVDALLDEAISVESQGWKGRAGTSLSEDKRNAAFFERYARLASEKGILRIAFLRIDGKPVATQIAIESDGGFWLLKIGYDEEYRKCSPGNLLMLETVKYAVEQGLSRYEFLGKSAPWTKIWTQSERPAIRLRVYPYTVRGLVALMIDGVDIGFKRLKTNLAGKQGKPSA